MKASKPSGKPKEKENARSPHCKKKKNTPGFPDLPYQYLTFTNILPPPCFFPIYSTTRPQGSRNKTKQKRHLADILDGDWLPTTGVLSFLNVV